MTLGCGYVNYRWFWAGLSTCCLFAVVACGDATPPSGSGAQIAGAAAVLSGGAPADSSGGASAASSGASGNTSGGSGGVAYSGPAIPLEDFAGKLAAAWCNNVVGCCQRVDATYDPSNCITKGTLSLQQTLAEEATSNVQYDPTEAGACVARYAALASTCTLSPDADVTDLCPDAFQGKLTPGSPCTLRTECMNPSDSFASCVALPKQDPTTQTYCFYSGGRGVRGDACNLTCFDGRPFCLYADVKTDIMMVSQWEGSPPSCALSDGLFCQASSHTCQPVATLGKPCEAHGCIEGAYCKNGTCVPEEQSGSCSDDGDCAAGFYCDQVENPSTPQCQPSRADGAPCIDGSQCNSTLCSNEKCTNTAVTEPNCEGDWR